MKCKKLLIFFLSLSFCSLFAQTGVKERIPVELRVAGIGNTGIEVIVVDTTLYLPAITVLSFIGIKNSYSPEELKIEGFYKTTSAPYEINCSALEARLKKIRVQLTSFDYLIEDGELFLRMEFIKNFFELEFRYNKRRLVIELSRVADLPKVKYVERQKRIEHIEARKIVLPQPDVTLERTFSIYDGGRLSWNVFNRYSKRRTPSHHYNLNFGSGLLGGDLYMRLYGIERERKPFQQFRTQWRVPIFEQPLIRQITIGDVTTGGIESRLVRGVEITNRPFQQRYLFGYEDYDGYFNPNIDVELKNTQADYEYSKTDTSGKYYFNVPIYYGQGILDIKSYDPWGFQESERYRMNVPYTLIPPGTAEYSIVGGKTKYTLKRYSSTANVQWGVTSNLTIGSSIDYIDF
ncbi:MAG: hypothetical protein HY800_01910, partial [Ignavibacteriales bacterium]|nr:hypothetical protein [Ignavibacteriales bacterium]